MARNPAIVPDVFISFDVEAPQDLHAKRNRAYFLWEFGKPPDIVIEIIFGKDKEIVRENLRQYERMRIGYAVVFDPKYQMQDSALAIYQLRGRTYQSYESALLPQCNLGFIRWDGKFEGVTTTWLRWTDGGGNLLLTGKEMVDRLIAER